MKLTKKGNCKISYEEFVLLVCEEVVARADLDRVPIKEAVKRLVILLDFSAKLMARMFECPRIVSKKALEEGLSKVSNREGEER